MLQWTPQRHVRLPDFYSRPRNALNLQCSLRHLVSQVFEVPDVSLSDNAPDKIVQLAIVEYSFRSVSELGSGDPDRYVHFDGLSDLRLVWKHTYVCVKP